MAAPLERYRARQAAALPAPGEHAHRDGEPPERQSSALVTREEASQAAGKMGLTLEDASAIVLNPPGEKPWPYKHFTKDQVKEIGAIVSEWLKVKLATIQTDAVDELLSKNRALTTRVGELSNQVADLSSEVAKLRNARK